MRKNTLENVIDLGPQMRALRRNAKLTLRELADQLGISQTHLVNVEFGRKTLGQTVLHRAQRVLDLGPHLVPKGPDVFSVTRAHLARMYDCEVDLYEDRMVFDAKGNMEKERRLVNCRPIRDDVPLREIRFATRLPGTTPAGKVRSLRFEGGVGKGGYDTATRVEGDRLVHCVTFSEGWRRSDGGGLTIEFAEYVESALSTSREEIKKRTMAADGQARQIGRFTRRMFLFVHEFIFDLSFPEGYKPGNPRLLATFGSEKDPRKVDLDGTSCRKSEIVCNSNRIRATVLEPLPESSFSIEWDVDERWLT